MSALARLLRRRDRKPRPTVAARVLHRLVDLVFPTNRSGNSVSRS